MNRHYKSIMPRGPSRIARAVVLTLLLGASALTLAVPGGVRAAAILPPLGTAASFGVLGGSAVTNTGPTTVTGDLGVSPGTAVSGFPPGIVSGTIHAGDAVAAGAQSDVTIAYNVAAGEACDLNLTGQDLGGMTLNPGVYCFDSSAQLTGQLTLNGQGNPDSIFIFQMGSTLTTASNARVLLTNGASPCRIFWQVGSSATVGTNTQFEGNILALTSITFNTGATTGTGLYARNGAVTLDTNVIQACGTAPTPGATNTAAPAPTNTVRPRATRPPRPSDTPAPPPTDTPSDTPVPTNTAIATSVATGTATETLATQTPVTPTQIATTPVATETETPMVVPQLTPEATRTVVLPGPAPLLPNTGGGLPWLSPFILLLSTLLLALGLGMRKLLRIRGNR